LLLEGAKVVWIQFTSEFRSDGALRNATPEQIENAFMEATNDLCEHDFGVFRQFSRVCPTISLVQYNARKMYQANRTSGYLRSLSPAMRKFLRKITREQDSSGAVRAVKIKMAKHRQDVAQANIKKDTEKRAKAQAAADELARHQPFLTLTEFDFVCSIPPRGQGYLSVELLTKELKWHWEFGISECIPKQMSQWGNRSDKITLVRVAIERYLALKESGGTTGPSDEDNYEPEKEVTVEDLEEYDSEEEYYS